MNRRLKNHERLSNRNGHWNVERRTLDSSLGYYRTTNHDPLERGNSTPARRRGHPDTMLPGNEKGMR